VPVISRPLVKHACLEGGKVVECFLGFC
jgi:hypothetical protein